MSAGFALKKASPHIMLAAGVCGVITTCVTACKATLKIDEILDESKDKIETIHKAAEDTNFREEHPEVKEYTEKDRDKDLCITYIQTAWKLIKLYGPSILIGAASIALLVGSHCIMQGRIAALGAAVTVIGDSFARYRNEIRQKYGPETESDIYLGVKSEKFETVHIDENGKEKKTKVVSKVPDENSIRSPFAVIFDERNPNYYKNDPQANVDNLIFIQNHLNEKLQRQGWLFLTDVRMAFGYKPVPAGQVVGWKYDPKDPMCACAIDIGIDHTERQEVDDFRKGITKSLVINLDPDGDILDDFYLFDKTHRVSTIVTGEF